MYGLDVMLSIPARTTSKNIDKMKISVHRMGGIPFNPKRPGGGGWNPPIGQEIACHFSQDHAMVTKILENIHIHPN